MSQVLFIIPGLVGLFIFLYKRSPLPNKEYLLLIYPPIISTISLFLGTLIVLYADIDYKIISDIIKLFKSIDGIFKEFANGPSADNSLFSNGQFSASILLSVLISLFMRRNFNADRFIRQSGLDFSDFTKYKLSLVELSSGKVYVGTVVQAPLESSPCSLITVNILMSGERAEEGVLKYTTFYDPSDIENLNSDDLQVSITLNSIITIREFDLIAFDEFLSEGKSIIAF